jgi:putative acetyltransferase
VRPDLAGHGLGSRLVEVAKRHCKGSLDLWTFQGNLGARRFYERRGFTAIEFTDGAANMEQAPDVRYRWTAQPGEGPPPSR